MSDHRLSRAAATLVREQFDVQPDEGVLIGVDSHTERELVDAIAGAVIMAKARPVIAAIPQLPFQGALADPYIPDALAAAAAAADVWFDCCFPYLAGSRMHDRAMQTGRTRYALLATAGGASFARLYGGVEFAALMDYQMALVDYLDAKAGSRVRFACPLGTDVAFTLDQIKLKRERVARSPGMHTVPGAQSLYPVMPSVTGRIVLQALFDEHYRLLRRPITLEVDGRIRGFSGAAAEDRPRLERALRRAAGGRDLGHPIHFTIGFHPAARITGAHFIEDIRAIGTNAIGMGLPWWEAGGGENHPDGVVMDQSLWIDGEPIVDHGRLVGPQPLMARYERLRPVFD
jgi:2,5-dihydroxypyridine 5,6-dioxygenase